MENQPDGLYVEYMEGVFKVADIRQGYPPPDDSFIVV